MRSVFYSSDGLPLTQAENASALNLYGDTLQCPCVISEKHMKRFSSSLLFKVWTLPHSRIALELAIRPPQMARVT
jgi:hypothetical protein